MMPDGNTAALNAHEREQARGAELMDQADDERAELVADYINDESSANEKVLLDYLGDLAGGSPDILRQIQRIKRAEQSVTKDGIGRDTVIEAAMRIAKVFTDCIDSAVGDELVEKRAQEIEAQVPCRCRDHCTC